MPDELKLPSTDPYCPSDSSSTQESSKAATKPSIYIKKSFKTPENERIFVPPSNCSSSLHQRFQRLLTDHLKHDLNPASESDKNQNTLINRLRATLLPYPDRTRCLASMGVKKRPSWTDPESEHVFEYTLTPHDNEPEWKQKYRQILQSKNYRTSPIKTKEELDMELEEYMEARRKNPLKTRLFASQDERTKILFEGCGDVSNPSYYSAAKRALKKKLASSNVEELDDELEEYMKKAREKKLAQAEPLEASMDVQISDLELDEYF